MEDKRTWAREGDVLLTIVGTIGRTCVLSNRDKNITFQRSVCIIKPKPELNPFFLCYQLQSKNKEINEQANGAAQKGFYLKQVERLPLSVPSLSEQKRIVAILDKEFDKIDALKENAEKNLQNAKDLFQAALDYEYQEKGEEDYYKIGDKCVIYNGGTPSTSNSSYWDGNIEWLTPKDMGKLEGMYVYGGERKITEEGVNNSSAKVLPSNSIILSSRAPIGYVAINKVPMATNQGCKGIIPPKDIVPEYLYFFLLKSKEMLNDLGTGATFKELSGGKLSQIIVPIPKTVKAQHEIVSRLCRLSTKCKELQDNYDKTITLCDDLKQALLRKAFNGEL